MLEIFAILLVFTLLGLIWLAQGYFRFDRHDPGKYPSLEILLTCHNEAEVLPELLEAVAELNWSSLQPLRIAVIDDRSTDSTRELMLAFVEQDPEHRRLVAVEQDEAPEVEARKKYALSKAIESTTADWVLTLDADSRPYSEWLLALFCGWNKEWIAIVPGFRFTEGTGFWGGFRRLEAVVQSFLMRSAIQRGWPLSAIGAGFAYRVSAFREVGGFTGKIGERISGDDDLLLHKFATIRGKIISKVGNDVALAVLDRDPGKYWRARTRHYSVAPDYPLFWKVFGLLVVPGALIAPIHFILTINAAFKEINLFLLPSILLLLFEYIVVREVSRHTATSLEWWHPAVLFFGFPLWALTLVWHSFRRKPGWS